MAAAPPATVISGLAAIPLPLAGGDWAGLNTAPLIIASGAAASAQAGAPPRLVVF